jgi:hypothetical protein
VLAPDVGSLVNLAAELRPFALLMAEDIMGFDPSAFHELARDVGATLLAVSSETVEADVIESWLREALAAAERKGR